MVVPDDEDIKKVENKVKVEITNGKAEGYDFTIVGFFLKKDSTFLRWLALVDVDGLMKDMDGEDSASYENLLKEID